MNKKKILNRTLPLIIALVVILVVAVSVTIFSGDKKTPMIDSPADTYLKADLNKLLGENAQGDKKEVIVKNEQIYNRLKNGENGLQFLVDMLDRELLTKEGYLEKATEDEIKKAIAEAVYGKEFEYDSEKDEDYAKTFKDFQKRMDITYGIKISDDAVKIADGKVVVSLTNDSQLKDYYQLIVARKIYTREKMGEDQEESYKKFIDEYEKYLKELYKFNKEEITKAPTAPTDGSVITSTSVQSKYEKENADSFWTLFVKYDTKEEAEKALLQVGVVIYNSTWYEYLGDINLHDNKYFDKENNKFKYNSLAAFYKEEGTELTRFEINKKLIELYNNAEGKEVLVEGTQYTVSVLSKEAYDKLTDEEKVKYSEDDILTISKADFDNLTEAEKANFSVVTIEKADYDKLSQEEKDLYVEVEGKYQAYQQIKAIIFSTELVKDDKGEVKEDDPKNVLYYTADRLTKVDSSIHSYIKSLKAGYAKDSSWNNSYTRSIQAKGSYYILGAKFITNEATDFEDNKDYGHMYDKDMFEKEDFDIKDIINLGIGYVTYTEKDGEKVFDFENSQYWKDVQTLLDDAVSSEKINEYMSKLRNEKGLIIFDQKIEKSYMDAYKSDYKATKKSNSSVVAKLQWKDAEGNKQVIEITAEELYNELEKVFGAITATDAFQYEYVLFRSEMIDYAKYKAGASLESSVYVTEYALANKGSKDALTKWFKVNTDGEVVFTADGTEFDVLVRKGTTKKEREANVRTADEKEFTYEVEDGKVTLTVSEEPDFLDAEGKFNTLDDQIKALKLYFTNGNFAEYGYDASYGWKNFLRDYFQQYYGITIKTNDDLKLYYIYEDAVKALTEDLTDNTTDVWETVYVPFMQQQYDKFFSVDAVHFLIYIQDEDGEMVDPTKDTTVWTEARRAAAESLYNKTYEILNKTKKTEQAKVLQDIVDAISAAPKFVANIEQTTDAQEKYFAENDLYNEYNEKGDKIGNVMKLTAEIKGVELETSLYKTLGLKAKYEDLGTVTADKMVKNFENALKLMWNQHNNAGDNGMKQGVALETNEFYKDFDGAEEYLQTEFGYHVLIANKFTGRPTDKTIDKDGNKDTVPVSLPTLTDIITYEKGNKEVDDLQDVTIASIKTFYDPIRKEFESSHWYQLNVMKEIITLINNDTLTFTKAENKAKAVEVAEYYIENYYKNLNFIGESDEYTVKLMNIATNAMEGHVNGNNNVTADNMKAILKTTEAAMAKVEDKENNDYKEALEAFNTAKAKYEAKPAA